MQADANVAAEKRQVKLGDGLVKKQEAFEKSKDKLDKLKMKKAELECDIVAEEISRINEELEAAE